MRRVAGLRRLALLPLALVVIAIPAAISAGLLWHGLSTRAGSSIALGGIGMLAWLMGLVLATRPRAQDKAADDPPSSS